MKNQRKNKRYLEVFSERLKTLRLKQGLRQSDLAKKAGLHQVEIAYYENGVRKPNDENMVKIAKVLKVNKDYLNYGEGEVELNKKPYGTEVILRHVKDNKIQNNLKKVQNLSEEYKNFVFELIDGLSKE